MSATSLLLPLNRLRGQAATALESSAHERTGSYADVDTWLVELP